jgi:hypothetical protein
MGAGCSTTEAASYAFVLAEAERRADARALEQLHRIGTPPFGRPAMEVERKWLVRSFGISRAVSLPRFLCVLVGGPEWSVLDLPNIVRGARFSTDALWTAATALDLVHAVPALRMPVFFFLGRHDHVIACETSAAYFEALQAPSKELVWFERSGHMPSVDEPQKFVTLMRDDVGPIAVACHEQATRPHATHSPRLHGMQRRSTASLLHRWHLRVPCASPSGSGSSTSCASRSSPSSSSITRRSRTSRAAANGRCTTRRTTVTLSCRSMR